MRLWHQKLLPYLPRQQLLGQHRECCALRGAGWGRKHATVDYVFKHKPIDLIAYHYLVMQEMERRGYHPTTIWKDSNYRGSKLSYVYDKEWLCGSSLTEYFLTLDQGNGIIYPEHNDEYLQECIDNLKSKGIEVTME